MEHTKKMALIDPRLLERFQQLYEPPPNPTLKTMASLDDRLKNVLSKSHSSEDDKVKEYNQTLHRYMTYEDKYLAPTSNPANVQSPVVADQWESDILESVPLNTKKKAQLLLNRIKASGGAMGWNTQGELLVKGEPIAGSDILDLVNDVLRKRQHFNPRGWEQFAQALRDTNVPQDLIGHPDRWAYIQQQPASTLTLKRKAGQTTLRPRALKKYRWTPY